MRAILPALAPPRSCAAVQADKDVQAILAIERGAFERWAKGDLNGFLEASDTDVDYFDPFLDTRLDSLPALRALYDKARERCTSTGGR